MTKETLDTVIAALDAEIKRANRLINRISRQQDQTEPEYDDEGRELPGRKWVFSRRIVTLIDRVHGCALALEEIERERAYQYDNPFDD